MNGSTSPFSDSIWFLGPAGKRARIATHHPLEEEAQKMHAPRVLDVGNCGHDHGKIAQMLQRDFAAEAVSADSASEALERLAREKFDLVLVNRKLDHDYSDGLEVIKILKQHPEFSSLPVMMITNYPEHQEQAVAAGAIYGFGKMELSKPETRQRLSAVFKTASLNPTSNLSSNN